jgi:uncharacterized membrane protein YhhN
VTPLTASLIGIAAVAAVVDWFAVWHEGRRARAVERIAKPAVMVALLAAVITWPVAAGAAGGADGAAVRPWLIVALAASLAGDVLLLPPGRFVAGLIAFLGAHLAYLVAFAQLPGTVPWLVAGFVVALIVVTTVGRELVAAARVAGLGTPVTVYLAVICAMATLATRTALPAAILGAWLFVASDAMLGWSRFQPPVTAPDRVPGPGPAREATRGAARVRLAVIVSYHVAQLLLVVALAGR